MIWGPYDLILNKQGFAAEREKSKKKIYAYISQSRILCKWLFSIRADIESFWLLYFWPEVAE